MSGLVFRLKKNPRQRVDVSPLSPHLIAELSTTEINAIPLVSGKRRIRVDELFDVSGANNQQVVFKNSSDKFDFIGREMKSGTIVVEGDAGAYLGLEMNGGTIHAKGNTGIFAACEMKNGLIHIDGNASDFLGGSLPGNKKGMQGGTVILKGNGGARLGDNMRRGTILVEGNVSDYCGSRMIAGTIAVMGTVGNHIGYGMNRGTLLLWQKPKLSATFADCGFHTSGSFLPLLFRSFRKLDSRFARSDVEFQRVRRYMGDLSGLGKGEILIRS